MLYLNIPFDDNKTRRTKKGSELRDVCEIRVFNKYRIPLLRLVNFESDGHVL